VVLWRSFSQTNSPEPARSRLLDLLVGIEHDALQRIINKARRQRHFQFPPFCFAQDASAQTSLEHMQFGFAHGAFESEQKPVIEVTGIIKSVLIQDQCCAQGADLQQPVPIGAVARQARDLQSHHNAGLAHSHFGDKLLKAFALGGGSTRLTLIAIDDFDALGRPTQRESALAQRILALGAFGVFKDLAQRRLPDVEISCSFQMRGGDFRIRIHILCSGVQELSCLR
jgi:hypothetical protein